jgi:hypothetical protein
MNKKYFPCPDQVVLKEIYARDISTHVVFIPDKPVVLEADHVLTLSNGAFFIGDKRIEGHWVDIRARG